MAKKPDNSELEKLLEQFGVYDEKTASDSAFARVLVIGPPKAGKTSCIAMTAPDPLILNCDGGSATKGAANLGAKFKVIDVDGSASWARGVQAALRLAEEGAIKTIVVDTISLLSDTLLDEFAPKFTGWDQFKELSSHLMGGMRDLCRAQAHLFVVAHMRIDQDSDAGQLPLIAGGSKVKIPAMLDDWILLDVDGDRDPVRVFLLGPQKKWKASGRNVRETKEIPADVGVLFEELGIKP